MKNLNDIKMEIMNEYRGHGETVDVYFHNTYKKDIHEGNFRYTADTKGTNVIGLFGHLGNDEYFNVYGDKVIAVIVNRKHKVSVRPVDDTNHNDNIEVFINKNTVEEMREV